MKVLSPVLPIVALATLFHETNATNSNPAITLTGHREFHGANNYAADEARRELHGANNYVADEASRVLGNFVSYDTYSRELSDEEGDRALHEEKPELERRTSEENERTLTAALVRNYRRALTAFWAPVGDNDERRGLTKYDMMERRLKNTPFSFRAPFSFRGLRERVHRAAAP
ncbi:Aste57867_7893 [Aphanomyces stellatus]|uniref:Aste57867_7893 protein n=1 Tax=Aphanomyces stellatus TaxID=120398 RepID=A0A485KIX6_9STRA|nr:hypothetical protein As57867_007863 [Aphanomyces stellatus]VFT84786.1 Aste57867_7893 [Aphanomyces stellatus]